VTAKIEGHERNRGFMSSFLALALEIHHALLNWIKLTPFAVGRP
jgi:hypothetical protein